MTLRELLIALDHGIANGVFKEETPVLMNTGEAVIDIGELFYGSASCGDDPQEVIVFAPYGGMGIDPEQDLPPERYFVIDKPEDKKVH